MAVYNFRVTIGMRRGGYTATETYISAALSDVLLGARIQALLTRRQACLNEKVEFVGVSVGQMPAPGPVMARPRRANFYPPGAYTFETHGLAMTVPENGNYAGEVNKEKMDQARSCLQVRLRFDTDRTATRYFSFVPDIIIPGDGETVKLSNAPAWSVNFDQFASALVQGGWQIQALRSDVENPHIPIRTWVRSGAEGTIIGIVVDKSPGHGILAGRFVRVYASRRRGEATVSYNGRYFVETVNTTFESGRDAIYLRGTETGDPASVKLPGTVRKLEYGYYGIQQFAPLRAGVHKRGNSYGAHRGRRLTRVSLDP